MKRAALAVLVMVGVLACAATSTSSPGRTVHALVWEGNTLSLGTLDAMSLAPRGRLLALGAAQGSVSTDKLGARLAVASAGVGVVVVDTTRMRVVWRLARGPHVRAVSWLSPNRLLVARHGSVLLIDPARLRIVARTDYEGNVIEAAAWRSGLVLLAESGTGKLEPARLVIVGPGARLRTVELARIPSGWEDAGASVGAYTARPGLAVDEATGTAFVAGGLLVARIDLATLAVSYRGSERTLSKLVSGPRRTAAWLGDGTLAVAGSDHRWTDAGPVSTPFGLRYLKGDRVTIVDQDATEVRVVGGLALAYGERYESGRSNSAGLAAYDVYGVPQWRLFGDAPVTGLQLAEGLAYAYVSGGLNVGGWKVVEPATGSIVSTPATPPRWDFFQVVG